MENIVIIGAGNVATHLSVALKNAGYNILQVYSQSEASAKKLADKLETGFTTNVKQILDNADIYFYCVTDNSMQSIIQSIKNWKGIHLHTSGSTSISVFEKYFVNYGAFYPLQTISKYKQLNFNTVPILFEANNNITKDIIIQIIEKIGCNYKEVNSEQRLKVHIAAVFASNFTNAMYIVADEILQEAGFTFDLIKPLIAETTDKIKYLDPIDAQTGPAVRNDTQTIEKHLNNFPKGSQKRKIYEEITRLIFRYKKS